MSDNLYPGGQVMIRIDGSKIRQIREQKGLTQLYIATAVEVTTDTVSRWENKRYPSIKKENGLKLAQALEVELDTILETENHPQQVSVETAHNQSFQPDSLSQLNNDNTISTNIFAISKKLLFFLLVMVIVGLIAYLYIYRTTKEIITTDISIRRTVPSHFIAGHPLPVFLHISNTGPETLSLILRENLPPGTEANSSIPIASNKDKKDHSIQWLKKVKGPTVFVYTLNSNKNFEGSLHFDGILKAGSRADLEITISGDNSSTATLFHWADTNKDNRISDEEILAVYDLTNVNETTGIDMDLLEEIWLGEGYIWHPDEQNFSILE